MTQRELTQRLAEKTGVSSIETANLQAELIEQIIAQIAAGNTVAIQGFGTFELKERAERKMYNPNTKEFQTISARQTAGFRPSTTLKDKIKG